MKLIGSSLLRWSLSAMSGWLVAGCGEKVSSEEVQACLARFGMSRTEQLTPPETKGALRCLDRALQLSGEGGQGARKQMSRAALNVLDSWVARGGKAGEVDTLVLPACVKLVMVYARPGEREALVKEMQGEWDFRVDFCVKGTVHRKYPQRAFEDEERTDRLCLPDGNQLWPIICARAGVAK